MLGGRTYLSTHVLARFALKYLAFSTCLSVIPLAFINCSSSFIFTSFHIKKIHAMQQNTVFLASWWVGTLGRSIAWKISPITQQNMSLMSLGLGVASSPLQWRMLSDEHASSVRGRTEEICNGCTMSRAYRCCQLVLWLLNWACVTTSYCLGY